MRKITDVFRQSSVLIETPARPYFALNYDPHTPDPPKNVLEMMHMNQSESIVL